MVSCFTKLFDCLTQKNNITRLADQLVEQDSSDEMEDEIGELTKRIFHIKLDEYDAYDVIGLREVLHLSNQKEEASALDMQLMKIAHQKGIGRPNMLCSQLRTEGWDSYWGYYDEFIHLLGLTNRQNAPLLSSINQRLSTLTIETRKALRKTLLDTQQENRLYLFNSFFSIFANGSAIEEDRKKVAFLQAFDEIKPEERADIIRQLRSLKIDGMSDQGKIRILQSFKKISQKVRSEVAEYMRFFGRSNFFSLGIDEQERIEVLEMIGTISPDSLTEVFKCSQCLDIWYMNKSMKIELLKTIAKVDKSVLPDVVLHLKSLDINSMADINKIKFLKIISKIDKDDMEEVVLYATRLFRHQELLSVDHGISFIKISVIEILAAISKEERADVIAYSEVLYNQVGLMNQEAIWKLFAIALIQKEKRALFIEEMKSLESYLRYCVNPTNIPLDLIFYLLPEHLKTEKKLSALQEPFLENTEYRQAIYTSLEQLLNNQDVIPFALQPILARFVYEHNDLFQLHDEDPLVQQAIQIASSSDIEGYKNPIAIYKKVKKLQNQAIDFFPQGQVVDGLLITINMKRLQFMSSEITIARKDLPLEVTLDAWNKLRENLKAKIKANPELEKIIEAHYGVTWNAIWKKSLKDTYLTMLLNISGERVSITEAKFRAVISNILAKSTACEKDCSFTEQEEVLIKAAMMIKNCSGGKQEGIDLVYGQLEPEYQYTIELPIGSEDESNKQRAIQYISQLVKKYISNLFRGENPPLMQELTGSQEIVQGPHQAIYVKNLVAHFIGIDHEITLDRHSEVLYDSLLGKSREEMLAVIFKYITLEALIKEVVRAVNSNLPKNSPLVAPLLMKAEYWNLGDEDILLPSLSARGAIQLLQESGFFLM